MKKILFVAVSSFVSVLCAAAAANDVTTSAKKSSVTAKISELCLSSYKSIAPRIEKPAETQKDTIVLRNGQAR